MSTKQDHIFTNAMNKLTRPDRWKISDNPVYGIDWKHYDDNLGGVYIRTFSNLWDCLEFIRDRYGFRFAKVVQTHYDAAKTK